LIEITYDGSHVLDRCLAAYAAKHRQAGPEGEYMYSCTISLTSSLDGVGGQRHTPAALPPRKTSHSLFSQN